MTPHLFGLLLVFSLEFANLGVEFLDVLVSGQDFAHRLLLLATQ